VEIPHKTDSYLQFGDDIAKLLLLNIAGNIVATGQSTTEGGN
jgi:hypothetical protein